MSYRNVIMSECANLTEIFGHLQKWNYSLPTGQGDTWGGGVTCGNTAHNHLHDSIFKSRQGLVLGVGVRIEVE